MDYDMSEDSRSDEDADEHHLEELYDDAKAGSGQMQHRTSPLPADCWTDVLQCLPHPLCHELQTLCRSFAPIIAPLLHHLHSDVQKATFKRVHCDAARHWQITLQSKSGRTNKVEYHHRSFLHDAMLASAFMRDIAAVQICYPNPVIDEGIVRFCFGRDGRRLEIRHPKITRSLFSALAEEHLSATNDREFTLIVTCPSTLQSDIRRQTTTAYAQYRMGETEPCSSKEIPSGNAVLTLQIALDVRGLDTMTVTRKRLIL